MALSLSRKTVSVTVNCAPCTTSPMACTPPGTDTKLQTVQCSTRKVPVYKRTPVANPVDRIVSPRNTTESAAGGWTKTALPAGAAGARISARTPSAATVKLLLTSNGEYTPSSTTTTVSPAATSSTPLAISRTG